MKRGLAICDKNGDKIDPQVKAGILGNLGRLYDRGFGRYEEAESYFKNALTIIEQNQGIRVSEAQETTKEYIDLLRRLGKENDAKALEVRIKSRFKK